MGAYADINAEVFAALPSSLHYRGEPNDWVKVTRPGARLHSFLEGPVFDDAGRLWCVDVPYGRIFRVDPNGQWTLAHNGEGQPHGLARMQNESAFAVADYRFGLMRFDPARGAMSVLCDGINSERFRGLGDVTSAGNGDLWFTDPGRSSLSDPTGRLLRLRAGEAKPDLVLANLPYPNGVGVSPDGKLVYVAITRANAVWRLLADAPDPVYPMVGLWVHLSGGLGPDGISVHDSGHVAVAHGQAGRAWVFDALGDVVARVRTPKGLWTTSVAWHPDGRRLAIVEAQTGSIYLADLTNVLS
ncbi:MAG TPA: SMP-30/gluconolactonase/LRE family protein [Casimicrobiaceae bacterium]|nr:SMP-30/gluconolactonase/LRE family protein [Casimicrobiaceae bacterium]